VEAFITGLLYTVHALVCVFLILVVLLQQGKGADLSVFGGGSTQTAFGARGATTLLHKLTVASFVIFTLTTLTIGIRKTDTSVLSGLKSGKAAAPAASPAKPAATPAATPAPASGSPAPSGTAPR
jgi:preprotein translocase subunit SecG